MTKPQSLAASNREARKYGFTIRRQPGSDLIEMKSYGKWCCWYRCLVFTNAQAAIDYARRVNKKVASI